MDRRRFLAVGGLAAATPVLSNPFAASAAASDPSFKRINFTSDGLGLDPREYSTLLQQTAENGELQADNYSNGGLIAQLEEKFAGLLGKEAAMFVPTGTLANHLAVRQLAGTDRRVLVQAESHLYNDSGDCAQTLSGLNLVPLAEGKSAIGLDEIKSWVERSARGRVEMKVGAISIESPVRRKDHERVGFDELERISGYAREQGIRLHLDGARLFNLPYHSGKSIKQYAALFDTVQVSLWKHFNGASGAILAGDAKFIAGLFHTRRMFGGSLPHAWPQVALVANYADDYEQQYAKAWQAADRLIGLLQSGGRFRARKVLNGTSKFFLELPGITPELLAARAVGKGIVLPAGPPGAEEIGLQVNATILRRSPEALAQALTELLQVS
ncbi:MAG: threonine aldolase family protein [Pseudoxanthomonas sp.]